MNQRTTVRRSDGRSRCLGVTNQLAASLFLGVLTLQLSACNRPVETAPEEQVVSEAPPVAEPAITKATIKGDLDEIRAQLDSGANIDSRDALGRTPLHMAAFYGRLKAKEFLIVRGPDINAKDNVGMTPLHAAVLSGGRQAVEVLIDKKADVAITSTSGQTVLHLSASTGQPKLSKYLIEKGANPLTKDADGKIPLDYAVQNQHPVTTKLLKGYSEKK